MRRFLFIDQGVQLKKTSNEGKNKRDFLSCRKLDVRAFFDILIISLIGWL
jgi:hypothetical protein